MHAGSVRSSELPYYQHLQPLKDNSRASAPPDVSRAVNYMYQPNKGGNLARAFAIVLQCIFQLPFRFFLKGRRENSRI